jgi:hypothetical protein
MLKKNAGTPASKQQDQNHSQHAVHGSRQQESIGPDPLEEHRTTGKVE